jgi:hypothetical protein
VQGRFTKVGIALALGTMLVVGTAGVGGASVETKGNKAKFCKQVGKLGEDVTQTAPDASTISEETAADLEKAFNKLSKSAPSGKLKTATSNIADFYGQLADGEDVTDVDSGDAEDFAESYANFGTYIATKCLDILIPDVTLPDISIPDVSIPDIG